MASEPMTLRECLDAARGHIKPAIGRAKSVRPQDAELIELLTAAIEEIDGAIYATTSPEPARSGAEGPTPGQAERLVSEMIGVESAIQQAMDRAQKVTRTLAALTVVVEDRPRFAATTTSPEPDPTEFTNPRYATGLTGAAYNLLTAIENGDRPNVHGWSVALRKELDAYLAGAPVDRALAASKPDTDERERVADVRWLGQHAPDDQGGFEAPCLVCGERWPCESYDLLMDLASEGQAARLTLGSGADEGLREAAQAVVDAHDAYGRDPVGAPSEYPTALDALRAALADSTNREAGE